MGDIADYYIEKMLGFDQSFHQEEVDDEIVQVDRVLRETDLAILVKKGDRGAWIPKSISSVFENIDGSGSVQYWGTFVPEWFDLTADCSDDFEDLT